MGPGGWEMQYGPHIEIEGSPSCERSNPQWNGGRHPGKGAERKCAQHAWGWCGSVQVLRLLWEGTDQQEEERINKARCGHASRTDRGNLVRQVPAGRMSKRDEQSRET